MSKTLKTDNLKSRPVVRTLVAVSLSISLAAFGCTTDRSLGNGDPVVTPGVRTSPTGNTSTGSETPTVPGPMFSSSIDNGQALPAVRPRASRADEAAAIIAGQAPRVRYLGVAMPGQSGRGYYSDGITGGFQNPALRTNPQVTVNSSISSGPTPVIASGAGGEGSDVGAAFVAGTSLASTTGTSVIGTGVSGTGLATGLGTTAASTATGTGVSLGGNVNSGAAPIFAGNTVTAATPTAATTLPLGTLATTITPTTSPTAFSGLNPPTAISSDPLLAANSTVTQSALANNGVATNANGAVLSNTNVTTGTTASATDTTTTANLRSGLTATRATSAVRSTTASGTAITSNATATGTGTTARTSPNPVRLTRDANGRVVISNATAQRR